MDSTVECIPEVDDDVKLKTVDDVDNTEISNDNEPINKKLKLLENEDNADKDDTSAINIEQDIPEEGFVYPLEQDASDMLDEVEFDGCFPSVTERYFTPYYQIDVQRPGDDICIRIHSNRICMISLAPSHIIFQENKIIKTCNFKVSDKLDRMKNKVSGKSKHGAQPLQSNSNLCLLSCNDGSSYMIKCCMIGKLVEVNERLIENPELLKKEPHFGGYIAIVLPNLKHLEKTREEMLTQELYEEAMKKRKENKQEKEKVTHMEMMKEKEDVDLTQVIDAGKVEMNKEARKEQFVNMEITEKQERD